MPTHKERNQFIPVKLKKMEKQQIQNAIDFLGVKVLSPLEEKAIVGGTLETVEAHHHTDEGRHHSHHDTGIV